ncbi:TetR/AcrR family transcriptional regulator [Leptospira idonii]|uniref:TetR/AcrR family transcriptional regulator n=1 Tax=Leptospira idonii TaxID=1193500 RepID=UPI0014384745|nr:TetR/AcrR family transcriptional regulator [Leptospira idonii]
MSRIIEKSALDLFSKRGYEGASISAIAKNASVSKSLIFRYFTNKEQILETIVNREKELLIKIIESVEETLAPAHRFLTWVDVLFQHFSSHAKEMKLLVSVFLHEDSSGELQKYLSRTESGFVYLNRKEEKIIESYLGVKNSEDVFLFRYLVQGALVEYLLDGEKEHLTRGKKMVLKIFKDKKEGL